MEELGGLFKRMPKTGILFLTGAMSISALPPLNGFVSEWYTYQALFMMGGNDDFIFRLAGPLALVMLALTGAFALICFTKLYNHCFSASPRSHHAETATEVPLPMTSAMGIAAFCCILAGIGSSWISPYLSRIVGFISSHAHAVTAENHLIVAGSPGQSILSMPLLTVLLLALPFTPYLIGLFIKGPRITRQHLDDPWACGYRHTSRMGTSPSGFTQPVKSFFSPLFRLRDALNPSMMMRQCVHISTTMAQQCEPVVDVLFISPITKVMHAFGKGFQKLQHGDLRIYCLYIVAVFAVLMLVVFSV